MLTYLQDNDVLEIAPGQGGAIVLHPVPKVLLEKPERWNKLPDVLLEAPVMLVHDCHGETFDARNPLYAIPGAPSDTCKVIPLYQMLRDCRGVMVDGNDLFFVLYTNPMRTAELFNLCWDGADNVGRFFSTEVDQAVFTEEVRVRLRDQLSGELEDLVGAALGRKVKVTGWGPFGSYPGRYFLQCSYEEAREGCDGDFDIEMRFVGDRIEVRADSSLEKVEQARVNGAVYRWLFRTFLLRAQEGPRKKTLLSLAELMTTHLSRKDEE